MRNNLKQLRKGFQAAINLNKSRIVLMRFPTMTDPITGETVRNQAGTKTSYPIYARIAHEREQVPINMETPAGLSTNLSRFIITDYNQAPVEHDTFTWQGKDWEVGPVDEVVIFGSVIGYQAPLKEA